VAKVSCAAEHVTQGSRSASRLSSALRGAYGAARFALRLRLFRSPQQRQLAMGEPCHETHPIASQVSHTRAAQGSNGPCTRLAISAHVSAFATLSVVGTLCTTIDRLVGTPCTVDGHTWC